MRSTLDQNQTKNRKRLDKLEIDLNYQNPNLTTTQLQPNLNLVGFDTIITLHTPSPHPTTGTLILPEGMVLEV